MSEVITPEVNPSDVLEAAQAVNGIVEPVSEPVVEPAEAAEPAPEAAEAAAEAVPAAEPAETEAAQEADEPEAEPEAAAEDPVEKMNLGEKTLSELVGLFEEFKEDVDRMKKSKVAEAIKSAFYKKLVKEKVGAGIQTETEIPGDSAPDAEAEDTASGEEKQNPFEALEQGFKSLYNDYKKERAEYNRELEKERENNLAAKQQIIEDLKNLVETQEDVSASFPKFREIQDRWKAVGPVPAQQFRNINDTYQFFVEKFYDMVKINRDLRDLDFKKNLEAKQEFVRAAEKLSEHENVVEAFKELQKLHEQWKEFGPVAKEYREDIWNSFKAATAVINKRYQAYFEGMKEKQGENLEAKQKLCERVEEIAAKEVNSSNEWNSLSKEIEDIQKEWKTIGFAAKKDNQKIYDRFRAACDAFYEKKRVFYSEYKDAMTGNLEKKMSLIEAAEALKNSTEWKKATDQFISLQKQWKEIGAVPRKKSEQLWKRFRAACDEFFEARDKQAKPENDFYANLKAKKKVVEDIEAYVLTGDEAADEQAARDFAARWQAIGFVPFKEKDAINQAYRDAVKAKFPRTAPSRGARGGSSAQRAPRSEKDVLIQKYNALRQEIDTYENNIGFFSASKNSQALVSQMLEKIEAAKAELKQLEENIRAAEQKEETSGE